MGIKYSLPIHLMDFYGNFKCIGKCTSPTDPIGIGLNQTLKQPSSNYSQWLTFQLSGDDSTKKIWKNEPFQLVAFTVL